MKIQSISLLLFTFLTISLFGQDMGEYTSSWEGKIDGSKVFNLKVEIESFGLEKARLKISNSKSIIDYPFDSRSTSILKVPFAENYSFEGVLSENGKEINGFIKSGMLLYHIKLTQSKNSTFIGAWNLLMINELKSLNFYLSVENGEGDDYQAYPILGDNRFTGTWCDNFQKEKDLISFTDFKTGLQFKGKLEKNKIQLSILLGNHLLTEIELKNSITDWKIGGFKNDNKNSILKLTEMEYLISKDSFTNTHSVVISKKGKIEYENYFDGYNSNIPHDMKSASKSISSGIVGIAKDKLLFNSVKQSIFDFLPEKYQTRKDSLKTKIDIQSLLTMSSGIDAIDYGINANPKSSATENNYQRTPDWIEAILKAPMIHKPNTNANYGSANPALLGGLLWILSFQNLWNYLLISFYFRN
ncbi:6-aminohexanoate-dimer hydrolase [Algibacter lectus]|uniref:6-aminohexanoate-dimer hydrolase n=1 Tax=Algibacter lectus TaxID=221126 RepID=A0A090X197_9FLAO|nr:serine hydrolase [Algibacter lectus]GAL82483.1 6-aminohexanoate-dimer hydrolase [Algibacter lectus]